jgi:hypothetical protein
MFSTLSAPSDQLSFCLSAFIRPQKVISSHRRVRSWWKRFRAPQRWAMRRLGIRTHNSGLNSGQQRSVFPSPRLSSFGQTIAIPSTGSTLTTISCLTCLSGPALMKRSSFELSALSEPPAATIAITLPVLAQVMERSHKHFVETSSLHFGLKRRRRQEWFADLCGKDWHIALVLPETQDFWSSTDTQFCHVNT